MNKEDLKILRTESKHKDFHLERQMFCIIKDEIMVAEKNSHLSHIEWFENEKWVNEENTGEFINSTIRGMYSFPLNKLFAYTGVGFFFDQNMIETIKEKLPQLKTLLHLNDETEICFGPVDKVIMGKEYEQLNIGKIKDLKL